VTNGLLSARPVRPHWGNAWPLAFVAALGLLMVTEADALSRTGRSGAHALFWLGLLTIVGPITWGVLRERATRSERLVLIIAAALALYAVKVVRDPFAFTFGDEFIHQHNTNEILRTGTLFGTNSVLPITPFYPGLASATAALAALTGLSTFGAGLLIIGVARLVATLALFLFVEGVLRSDRAAAVAVLSYVAVPNYLYFSAQFAYESLALPLAIVVVATVAQRAASADRDLARRWTALGIVLLPAVVMTHHLTAYALLGTLLSLCVLTALFRVVRARRRTLAPEAYAAAPIALTASLAVLVAAWLTFAGRQTTSYLSPVLGRAIAQTWGVLSREAPPRALFQAGGGSDVPTGAPWWEPIAGLSAVAVLLLWVPVGLLALRRRLTPMLVLLGLCSVAYLATFPLRFVPAAWESAARASEFLFIGVATVLAATQLPGSRSPAPWRTKPFVSLAVPLIAVGGLISGWPTDRRVAFPYRIERNGAVIEPEEVTFGKWAGRALPPGQRIATEDSEARVLQLYGYQDAVAGGSPDVRDMLHVESLDDWMITLLRDHRFQYVAIDRRTISTDVMRAYFFASEGSPRAEHRSTVVSGKFDRSTAFRVFDSGEIVMYDVEPLLESEPP
jgi:hypothetical protein